jgi:hypothetical protein
MNSECVKPCSLHTAGPQDTTNDTTRELCSPIIAQMPPAIPTPFYNACHFPFATPEGEALYNKLSGNFRCSTDPSDAVAEIIQELKKIDPERFSRLKLYPLKKTDGDA